MSVDYYGQLVLGFVYSFEEIRAAFGTLVPRETRLEDRFDPKTGQKLAPEVVVVRQEGWTYRIPDGLKVYDEDEFEVGGFLDALATVVDCRFCTEVDGYGEGLKRVCFGPDLGVAARMCTYDDSRVSVRGELPLPAVLEASEGIGRIGQKLLRLGLPSRDATVAVFCSVV